MLLSAGITRRENEYVTSNVSEELAAFFFIVVYLDYIEDGSSKFSETLISIYVQQSTRSRIAEN